MSAMSQAAHLSNHQRNTLRQIFQHPAGHNIEWRAVLSLLGAVGSAHEQHSGKVAVTIASQTEYFDPPRHKRHRHPGSPQPAPDADRGWVRSRHRAQQTQRPAGLTQAAYPGRSRRSRCLASHRGSLFPEKIC